MVETYVASYARWKLIYIYILDKFGYYCSFRNNKVSLSYDSNVDYESLIDIECSYCKHIHVVQNVNLMRIPPLCSINAYVISLTR